MLLSEVRHDVSGLGRGQQADGAAVAEKSQVPVVRHDQHRRVPRPVAAAGARPRVVHRADVAPAEAQAWALAEHRAVRWILRCEWEVLRVRAWIWLASERRRFDCVDETLINELLACDCTCKLVVHGCKSEF